MHSKTFLAVFALATAVVAAPVPDSGDIWGASPKTESPTEIIEGLMGSPFGTGMVRIPLILEEGLSD
jgi:hypothetical protein